MDTKALREETKKLTLLYVEDENEIRSETELFFSKYFKSVDSAKNGKEGLELFKKYSYDVVISDLKMPIMGGEEMMQAISELEPKTVLVSMSGISGSNGWTKRVYDFSLTKPASIDEIYKILFLVVEEVKKRNQKDSISF